MTKERREFFKEHFAGLLQDKSVQKSFSGACDRNCQLSRALENIGGDTHE